MCLRSRALTFRLGALQRLRDGACSRAAWSQSGRAFLRCLPGLRSGRQLFFLRGPELARGAGELPVLFRDPLRAWGLLSAPRSPMRVARGDDLLAEPLLWEPG